MFQKETEADGSRTDGWTVFGRTYGRLGSGWEKHSNTCSILTFLRRTVFGRHPRILWAAIGRQPAWIQVGDNVSLYIPLEPFSGEPLLGKSGIQTAQICKFIFQRGGVCFERADFYAGCLDLYVGGLDLRRVCPTTGGIPQNVKLWFGLIFSITLQ